MPRAARTQRSAAVRSRQHAGRRRELIIGPRICPADQASDEICVRGGSLLVAASLEGRVHGCNLAGAIAPFSIGSSSSLQFSSQEASSSLFADMERCLDSRELFGDAALRLDKYMAIAKQLNLLLLLPDLACTDVHDRAKLLLRKAMASLATEFCECEVRIWRLDALRDRLGVSRASIWDSVRRSCSSGSTSDSGGSSGISSGTSGSSNGATLSAYHWDPCEDMSVRSGKAISAMTFIDCKSLSILEDIAGVMIDGGYEDMLRSSIKKHSAQLASHVEILDINNISGGHLEESKEILLKVCISEMRIIVFFLSEIQRQLNGQALYYFNRIKEDYFLAIAKHFIIKLLDSARSICILASPPIDPSCKDTYAAVKPDLSKMVNMAIMYQELNYTMPTILALFSGQTKEYIVKKGEGLIYGLSDMFLKLSVEQNNLVRSQNLVITDTGVHHSTKHTMDHMRLLVQHKGTICLMLKGDTKAFGELVTHLISSLEFMLDMNSRCLQLQGQQQMFLLNNLHLMLKEVEKNTDLVQILGEGWLWQRHDQLNLFITGYVDASWTPVMSCLVRRTRLPEILWSHQVFDKFTSSFEMTYNVQKTWKVTDPLIRQKLHVAISQKVIPEYRMYVDDYMEKQKSARYSVEQLESQLHELFER